MKTYLDPNRPCSVCRRPLAGYNRSGLCKRCHHSYRCHGCGQWLDNASRWCDACLFALDDFRNAMSTMPPCPRPDAETLAERLALYEDRAARHEPLFA